MLNYALEVKLRGECEEGRMSFWQWCLMKVYSHWTNGGPIKIDHTILSVKQTEKTNRGNSHEIPILDVGACIFLLWKKERDVLLMGNPTSIVALWINGKG
jgi:hypothetical protein